MTVINDPWFYAVAIPAMLITGISKGGFAGGLGIVAVPLMSLAVSPLQAAAIMLPVLVVMDGFGLWAYRGRYDAANLKILVPAGFVGIAAGTFAAGKLSDAAVELIIGTIAVSFALKYWIDGRRGRNSQPYQAATRDWRKGGFWGAIAGFTSFVSHAGGPPFQVYMLPQRLDKGVFVGTAVLFFAMVNAVKLVPYAWLGLFGGTTLATALILMPLAPLGMGLGVWLHNRIDETSFYRICYGLVLIVGADLVITGLRGLAGF